MDRASLQVWFDASRAYVQGFVNHLRDHPPMAPATTAEGGEDRHTYQAAMPEYEGDVADVADGHGRTILENNRACRKMARAYGSDNRRVKYKPLGELPDEDDAGFAAALQSAWRTHAVKLLSSIDHHHAAMRADGSLGAEDTESTDG